MLAAAVAACTVGPRHAADDDSGPSTRRLDPQQERVGNGKGNEGRDRRRRRAPAHLRRLQRIASAARQRSARGTNTGYQPRSRTTVGFATGPDPSSATDSAILTISEVKRRLPSMTAGNRPEFRARPV
jgi:hypothetical protein